MNKKKRTTKGYKTKQKNKHGAGRPGSGRATLRTEQPSSP